MYAVIQVGKHQYKVQAGQKLSVEKIEAEIGSEITFTDVVALSDGQNMKTGTGLKASVVAVVEAQAKDPKVHVFKRKPRKSYKRSVGHRQPRTDLIVTRIEG